MGAKAKPRRATIFDHFAAHGHGREPDCGFGGFGPEHTGAVICSSKERQRLTAQALDGTRRLAPAEAEPQKSVGGGNVMQGCDRYAGTAPDMTGNAATRRAPR